MTGAHEAMRPGERRPASEGPTSDEFCPFHQDGYLTLTGRPQIHDKLPDAAQVRRAADARRGLRVGDRRAGHGGTIRRHSPVACVARFPEGWAEFAEAAAFVRAPVFTEAASPALSAPRPGSTVTDDAGSGRG